MKPGYLNTAKILAYFHLAYLQSFLLMVSLHRRLNLCKTFYCVLVY